MDKKNPAKQKRGFIFIRVCSSQTIDNIYLMMKEYTSIEIQFFNDIVKKQLPNIVLDKWVSAQEIGLDKFRKYENTSSRSFICNYRGIKSFKSKDDSSFLLYSEVLGVDFKAYCNEQRRKEKSSAKSAPAKFVRVPPSEIEKRLSLLKLPKGSTIYKYFDTSGYLLGLKVRNDKTKKMYQLSWNGKEWQTKGYVSCGKRPFYGLERIKNFPKSDIVFIVEGEKASESLLKAGYSALGIPGSTTYQKLDYAPLEGLKLALWPDNDEAGVKCMKGAKKFIEGDFREINVQNIEKKIGRKLSSADDAADLDDREKALVYQHAAELFELNLSDNQILENYLSCFFAVGNENTYYYPADTDLAARLGREKYTGEFRKINFRNFREILKINPIIGGVHINFGKDGGIDPFAEYKQDGIMVPSRMLRIFQKVQRKYKSGKVTILSDICRLKAQLPLQKVNSTGQYIFSPDIYPFLDFDNHTIPDVPIHTTRIYKEVVYPVLGENSGVFLNWLSRYVAAHIEGKKEIISRIPIMCILGDPEKGKSALVSIVKGFHGGKFGDLIKYALDQTGFGTTELINPLLVADDPNTDIDPRFPRMLRSACKNIHTGVALTVEKKGRDAFTGKFRITCMMVANTEERNIKVLRELCDEDMKNRFIFIKALGRGMLEEKTNEQASAMMTNILEGSLDLQIFAGALYHAYKKQKNKPGYLIKNYIDDTCREHLESVSEDMEISKFITWLARNFNSNSTHYLKCLQSAGEIEKFVFYNRSRKYNEIRLPMKALKDLYKYYRECEFSGEKSTLVRYLLGENDDERGAISPLSKSDTIRNVCKGLASIGVSFERIKFSGNMNCVCFKEPELLESPEEITNVETIMEDEQNGQDIYEQEFDTDNQHNANNKDSKRLRRIGVDHNDDTIWFHPR